MSIELPAHIAAYIAGESSNAPEAIVENFTADAVVRDEGRTIQGHEAIQAWKIESKAKYKYTVEPLRILQDGDSAKLTVQATGDFPGSPAEMEYTFVLSGGRIASLEIN